MKATLNGRSNGSFKEKERFDMTEVVLADGQQIMELCYAVR
jgi:hypothetical protein